jgi:DNA-3-methyladenine glycosylase I
MILPQGQRRIDDFSNSGLCGGMTKRCRWCTEDPLYIAYHDEEWGVPVHDDVHLFEMLILEGAQAGLSWFTILKKRENYRRAYEGFRPEIVAKFGARKVASLLKDASIVRNRAKIAASIGNAKATLQIQAEFGSLDKFLWSFVGGRTVQNRWKNIRHAPTHTAESDSMSKALLARGFKFVGTTICYSFMQAVGMVNDHEMGCSRYAPVRKLSRAKT